MRKINLLNILLLLNISFAVPGGHDAAWGDGEWTGGGDISTETVIFLIIFAIILWSWIFKNE